MTATPHSLGEHQQVVASDDLYDDGRLRVEHDNYYVTWEGEALKFPRTEFLLLSRLARSMERYVRAEELWRRAWGDHKPYNSESLHVHIYRLRSKLEPYGIRIETMINVGYRMILELPERPANEGQQKSKSTKKSRR